MAGFSIRSIRRSRDRRQLARAPILSVSSGMRHRLAVEVAVRDAPRRARRARAGCRWPAFSSIGDHPLGVVDRVAHGAVHLRRAAQRVGVLHPPAPAVRGDDLRVVEQAVQVRGRRDLAGVRAQRLELGRERRPRSAHRLDRLARRRGRPASPSRRARHSDERADRRHELRAVDEREPLLRGELDRREARPAPARSAPGSVSPPSPGVALADEHEREVRERREIAARPQRPARRHHRHARRPRACRRSSCDELAAHARRALRERVRAQQHRRPHDLVRERVADAAGVAAHAGSAAARRPAPASMCTSTKRPKPVFTP